VPSDDALAVEAVEDLTEADDEAAGAGPREAAAAGEHGRQVVAVEEVGGDEDLALEGHADVGDVDEVDEGGGVAGGSFLRSMRARIWAMSWGCWASAGDEDADRDGAMERTSSARNTAPVEPWPIAAVMR
jgi:hypothetical protein